MDTIHLILSCFILLLIIVIIAYYLRSDKKQRTCVLKTKPGEVSSIKNCAKQMLHIMTSDKEGDSKEIVSDSNPILVLYDDFLSEEEADFLIQKYKHKTKESTVVSNENGYVTNFKARKSFSHYIDKTENDVIKKIEEKTSRISGFPESFIEPLQFLKYEKNGYFRPHHDYFSEDYTNGEYQRYATFFVYLNDEFEGGTTLFPELGIEVQPKKGRAIFWFNVDERGNVNPRTLHTGTDVLNGEKYGLNIWIRNKRFYD